MKDIVILGSKGCAKEILFILQDNNRIEEEWNILGFIDQGEGEVSGYPILGDDDWLMKQDRELYAVCAIGEPKIRKRAVEKFQNALHIKFPAVVSKRATLGNDICLGRGSIVGLHAILTAEITLEDFAIVNTGSIISHECHIGRFSTVSPGCCVSGNVCLEEGVYLGTGSRIIQGLQIGAYTMVGAGATVIRNLPAQVTAVGCPARIIKSRV